MSDNRDYWSKLLGDSFDDDLYSSVLNTPDDTQPQNGSVPGEVRPSQSASDDTARFVEFDLSAKNSASELNVPDQPITQERSDIGDEDFDIDFDFED